MKRELNPKMLYFGTPVVLVSSLNPDGTTNIAPMSSAWWVGKTAMLGLSVHSQTVRNLEQRPACVLNLVEDSEKRALFAEMFRVLRRGGRAACCPPGDTAIPAT